MKKHYQALMAVVCALALAGAFALVGCSSGSSSSTSTTKESEPVAAESVELQVFAANSLEKALPDILPLFTSSFTVPGLSFFK